MEPEIELIWLNKPTTPPGQAMRQHSHACYQFYYILKGSTIFSVDNQEIPVSPGTALLIPPFTQHHSETSSAPLCAYELKLIVHDPFLQEHLSCIPAPLQDNGHLKPVLDYLHSSWLCKEQQNIQNIRHILYYLLLRFFVSDLNYYVASASHFIDTRAFAPVTQKIFSYLEKNFANPFSLDALSAHLNYNKSYLCSVFRQDTGYSIVDYLNFVRIRHAVICFMFYGEDLYSTRDESGFPSPGHFSRTFKELVGLTPREFRTALLSVSHNEVNHLFEKEPIVNYRMCSVEDAFSSLRSIGQITQNLIRAKFTEGIDIETSVFADS